MSTDEMRDRLLRWVESVQDETKLAIVFNAMNKVKDEGKISIEQYNRQLNEAEAEYREGKHISHDEMLKKTSSW